MNKQEFLYEITQRLEGLPEREIQRSVDYYSEMIDDRIEDGMSEEQAVKEIGSVDDAVNEILRDIPLKDVIRAKTRNRRKLKTWEIVLLAAGSPIWGSLAICALAVIFSLYVAIWAVVVSFWAVLFAFAVSGLAAFVAGWIGLFQIPPALPAAAIGTGLLLMGLALLLVVPMLKLTKVTAKLAKVIVLWIKSLFIGGKKNA